MTDSFEEKIERKMDEWREIAKKRAKAKAEVVYLEQFRKAKLAILASQAPDGSEASRDRWARSHAEYLELLRALAVAVEDFESLDYDLRIRMRHSEIWQTEQANRRSERRQYGDHQ